MLTLGIDQDNKENEHYAYCHNCQLARGAEMPEGPMVVTQTHGICPRCRKNTGLIPNMDYNWPETGGKAWFD